MKNSNMPRRKRNKLVGKSWRWIDSCTKRDAEIIHFAEKMEIEEITRHGRDEVIETPMFVTPLGNYNHAADEYELLIHANRRQVREIRKIMLKKEFQK